MANNKEMKIRKPKSKSLKPKKVNRKAIKKNNKKTVAKKALQNTFKNTKANSVDKKTNKNANGQTTENEASDKFDLNEFIIEKLGKATSKNKKQIISDRNKSSLSDLVNFNIHLAYSVYKITDKDSLESTLHSFQAKEDIEKLGLSPAVAKACKEVAMFRDLLLLGDLPTISQEKRPFEWIYLAPSLTYPAQVALMTSFLTLSIKLTGNKPSKLYMKVPGGSIAGKNKEDVVSYLAILQTIAESMSRRNNWEKKEKFSNLHIMNRDLGKIIGDF